MAIKDITPELAMRITNEDMTLSNQDKAIIDRVNEIKDAETNTKKVYESLMSLNTEILAQRTYIHQTIQDYKAYNSNGLSETSKVSIRNRLAVLSEKSTHLSEIRNDMSVFQRVLHSSGIY